MCEYGRKLFKAFNHCETSAKDGLQKVKKKKQSNNNKVKNLLKNTHILLYLFAIDKHFFFKFIPFFWADQFKKFFVFI